MTEKTPLRRLDDIESPDLWPTVRSGLPRTGIPDAPDGVGAGRRIATGILAFAVAGAAGFLLVRAFDRAGPPRPVGSEGPTGAAIPSVVELRCDGVTTELLSPDVAPQPDGLHFQVQYADGVRSVVLWVRGAPTRTYSAFELEPAAGSRSVVLPVPPSDYFIRCENNDADSNNVDLDPTAAATLNVVDANGVWSPDELTCPSHDAGMFFTSMPVDESSLRLAVPGIEASDEIVQVGYPQSFGREWGVNRQGELVARMDVVPRPDGSYFITLRACTSVGIGNA